MGDTIESGPRSPVRMLQEDLDVSVSGRSPQSGQQKEEEEEEREGVG